MEKSFKGVSLLLYICMNWFCLPDRSEKKKNLLLWWECRRAATENKSSTVVLTVKQKSVPAPGPYRPRCQLEETEMSQGDEVILKKPKFSRKTGVSACHKSCFQDDVISIKWLEISLLSSTAHIPKYWHVWCYVIFPIRRNIKK